MAVQVRQAQSFLEGGPRLGAGEWGTCMRKVIAYQGRAEEWRRRASEATSGRKDGCGLGVAGQNARNAA